MDRSVSSSARFRAFTLVELLVVIGIIALLVAILLPTLNKARQMALAVECSSNMRQMGIGLRMYAEANNSWIPASGEDGDATTTALTLPDKLGWASECLWMNAVSRATFGKSYDELQVAAMAGGTRVPINGDHHVLVCPAAPPAVGIFNSTNDPVDASGYFLMWGNNNVAGVLTPAQRQTFVCYAMNYKLFGSSAGWGTMGKMTQLHDASDTCVIFEKRTSVGEVTAADDAYYASQGGGTNKILGSPVGRFRGDWRRFSTRHRNGGNVLFADGHVDFFTLRDVLTPGNTGDWNKPGKLIWNITGPAN